MKNDSTKSRAISECLRMEILDGKFDSTRRLPSEHQLMRRFSVARETVRCALRELLAKDLVSRRPGYGTFLTERAVAVASRTFGVIVPDAYYSFYTRICRGIDEAARANNWTTLLASLGVGPMRERAAKAVDFAEVCVREKVSGVFFQPLQFLKDGVKFNRAILDVFERAKIPVVLLDSDYLPLPQRSEYDLVGIDNVLAGYELARHIIAQGARRIWYFSNPLPAPTSVNRGNGVGLAVTEAGLRWTKDSIFFADPADTCAARRLLSGRNVAEMEKQGVRIFFDITNGSLLRTRNANKPSNLAMKSAVMAKTPAAWTMWTNCAERILHRRSTQTGRTFAEDPNVLGIMTFNEQATGAKLMLQNGWKNLPEDIQVRWRELLGGDPENFYAKGGKGRVQHLRLSDLFAERAADYRRYIHEIGGRMPVSSYNSNVDLGACAARWRAAEMLTYNFHFSHPQRGFDKPGSFFPQGSSLARTANGSDFCYGNRIRLADRPFAVSELSHAYPNARRFEAAMLPASYAALNDYQAIMWHEGAVDLKAEGRWPRGRIDVFKMSTSPVARAS